MKIEVVSALPHSNIHTAVLSRRHRSVICAAPYEVFPLESCSEPLPSTSNLCEFPIECLQLSTDERTIGVATNAILKVADLLTGREVRNLTGHISPITSLSASKFSPYCWYTGSSDSNWYQWDTRMNPSKIFGLKSSGVVRSLAVSPGDRFVAVGTDETIQIFDSRQREIIKHFDCSGHFLEFHPSDVLMSAVGHDRIVRFFCLESMEMISQSDPFLDDIQASAFDTHVMIATTNDSINLLTWEPCCDILTTVPLKNVDKVVNVNANGLDLDFICIGENTERLEMRTYAIEELLSYSPSHELCGSIYEEDEDPTDLSPIDESKPLPELVELETRRSPVMSSEETETSASPVNSSNGSSHSSPASPAKPAPVKQRSTSQKFPKSSVSTSSKSSTSSKTLNPKTSSSRSITPVSTKPPSRPSFGTAKSVIVSSRPSLSGYNRGGGGANPSPSMSDLRTTKSIAGSTQSLMSERGPKKRSTSSRRNQEPITITYLGRPRTPSEGEISSSTSSRNRRPSPSVPKKTSPPSIYAITSSPAKKLVAPAPVKKQNSTSSVTSTSSRGGGAWSSCIDTVHEIGSVAKRENRNIRRLKLLTSRRTSNADVPPEVCADEQLVLTATRILSRRNDWSLNTCHAYLPVIIDNLSSVDPTNRSIALEGLTAIADTLTERLIKFSGISNSHKIGVDIAAEERAEKAKTCVQQLRELVNKRDTLYKHLDEVSVYKLDLVLEQLKKI